MSKIKKMKGAFELSYCYVMFDRGLLKMGLSVAKGEIVKFRVKVILDGLLTRFTHLYFGTEQKYFLFTIAILSPNAQYPCRYLYMEGAAQGTLAHYQTRDTVSGRGSAYEMGLNILL